MSIVHPHIKISMLGNIPNWLSDFLKSEEYKKNAVLPQGSYITQNFTVQTDTAQIRKKFLTLQSITLRIHSNSFTDIALPQNNQPGLFIVCIFGSGNDIPNFPNLSSSGDDPLP